MTLRKLLLALLLAPLLSAPVRAEENLVTFKSLSVDLALALARAALTDCQKHGYQVSVAVVDRFGVTQVLLRDRFAGAHTVPTATGKPGRLSASAPIPANSSPPPDRVRRKPVCAICRARPSSPAA